MKKIDWYIIKKFLGTFLFSIFLILLIVIVFDISEKIDDFIENKAPLNSIIFDYYLNFIPYFGNLFIPLFTFIAVIFFTSKMAGNTEIISILTSGFNFYRFLFPFVLSALIICVISFILGNFIIPKTNVDRLKFENKYIKKPYTNRDKNMHMQINPGDFIYLESYNSHKNIGYKFSMEKFKNGKLQKKIYANYIQWDSSSNKWNIHNYFTRNFNGLNEEISQGKKIDTVINLEPNDFNFRLNNVETMNFFELNEFINEERMKGSKNLVYYLIEKHKRIAFPFATIILTIIAVAFSSRKVKGGLGIHLGIGLLISFSYILFMQFSTTFATNGQLAPGLAVWIPNLIYIILGSYLLFKTPK